MTVTEWSHVVVAGSAAAIAITTLVVASRLMPLLRRLDEAAVELRAVLERLRHVATDLESVSRDARYTGSRVSDSVHRLLDQAEPPLRTLAAAIAGARAGLSALVRGRPGADGDSRDGRSSRGPGHEPGKEAAR